MLEQNTDSDVSTQEDTAYSYNSTSTSGAVTLKVEWNEPVLGQDTTFHVSAMGGSGAYKFSAHRGRELWLFLCPWRHSYSNYLKFRKRKK